MGSAYFYLESLLALHELLSKSYANPAIVALDYTLTPGASYPTQIFEAISGYYYTLSFVKGDASRVCIAGDSAGATIILGMLLELAQRGYAEMPRPAYAALISPWSVLENKEDRNTCSDYLNADILRQYGKDYAGAKATIDDPLVFPGECEDLGWWARAAPTKGFHVAFGSEEILAPETRLLVERLRKAGISVTVNEEVGGIHAWVIARLFLEETMEERVKGLKELVDALVVNLRPQHRLKDTLTSYERT